MNGAPQVPTAAPDAPQACLVPDAPDMQALQTALAALRVDGAQRLDPVRFHHIERLSGRLASAPLAVRRILLARLETAMADCRARLAAQPAAVAPLPSTGPVRPFATVFARRRSAAVAQSGQPVPLPLSAETPSMRLRALNRYIAQAAGQDLTAATNHPTAVPGAHAGVSGRLTTHHVDHPDSTKGELKSARRFGETWSRLQSEHWVEQVLQRSPENAGPFNAHMLMARSLAIMRDLSPDYLHRFMQHADTLLWLDQATARLQPTPGKAKPPRPARARK